MLIIIIICLYLQITQNSILNCYCPEKSPKDSLQFQWFGKNSPINISFPVKIYMDDTSEKESVRVTLSLPLGMISAYPLNYLHFIELLS